MRWFECIGEYGPIGGMSLSRYIRARNETIALSIFCKWVENHHPIEWKRMGRSNVYAYERN